MKILMALNSLDIGGAETHVVELAKEIVRRGHHVVMVSSGGVYEKEIEGFGIKHYTVTLTSRSPLSMFSSKVKLKKIIKKEKPDVVHAHARIPGFLVDMIHRELKSFVFVTTAHGAFDTSFLVKALTRWGEKTLAVSEDLKKYLLKNYDEVKEKDIYVSINGIDGNKFSKNVDGSKAAREFDFDAGAKKIVYVSRLNPDICKPAYGLIEKIKKLDESVPGVQVVIVGGGTCYEDISKKAQLANVALGRRAIITTGPRTDINVIHANADVCVGVSRAILEPMLMEKKCVIAGQEGYIGILGENNIETAIKCNFTCRGCDKLDCEIMTDDIIKLLNMDEKSSKSITDFGRQIVEHHYSVKKMADDNIRMYNDALKQSKKHAVILGYYGYGNSGDDALLGSIIKDMKEINENFNPIVLSHNSKNTQSLNVECANRFNVCQIIKAFKKTDALILGGGSLIQDVTSTKSLLYYLWCIKKAKKYGLKVMLYANGIGPIIKEENKKRTAEILNSVDVITLRDEASRQLLEQLGVEKPYITVTADPAFAFETEVADITEDFSIDGDYVCMSVRNWSESDEKVIQGMADMADYISENYSLIPVFIPMQFEKDLNPGRIIASKMKNRAVVIHKKLSLKQIFSLIKYSKAVVAVRLHMLIFGAASEIPSIGIDYDPKIKGFQNYIGIPYVLEKEDIQSGGYKQIIDEFMENRENVKEILISRLPEIRQKAKENAKIASDIIFGERD